MKKIVAGVVVAGGLAAALLFVGPKPVGPATFVVIARGDSMEPRFHVGDLVAVRGAPSYAVGDIVAFHSDFRRVVLHRIIATSADGRFTTRGDHNDFTDPFKPSRADILGKMWWAAPKAGYVVSALRKPAVAGGVVGVLSLLMLAGVRLRRRRRAEPGEPDPIFELEPASHVVSGAGWSQYAVVPAAVALFAAILAAVGWVKPLRTNGSLQVSAASSFAYRAPTPAGSIYGARGATTGMPVFFKASKSLASSYAFKLETGAPHAVEGDVRMQVVLSATNGFTKTIMTGAPVAFRGDGASASAVVSLAAVQRVIHALEGTAGVANGPYVLETSAVVAVRGTVAARPYTDSFTASYRMRVDQFQLQVDRANLAEGVSPFASGADRTLALPGAQPNSVKLFHWRVGVQTLRAQASTVAAGAGMLALLLFLFGAPWRRRDELDRIVAKYGRAIVPVRRVLVSSAIDVESFDALVQIARHSELMVLLHRDSGSFYVRDGSIVYRYATVPVVRSAYQPPSVATADIVRLHENAPSRDGHENHQAARESDVS